MKNFQYTYLENNKEIAVKITAKNIGQVKNFLKSKGIKPKKLVEVKPSILEILTEEKTVKTDDIIVFSQLFAGCIKMGLSIKDSLDLLARQVESRLLQARLNEIMIDVETGAKMSDAFKKHTDIFPKFYPMLLKAGESSGDLPKVLEYIGSYLERVSGLKKELIGVFTYPGIVSLVGLGLLVLILIFVAPTFKDVFMSTKGMVLPVPTVVLFYLSDTIKDNSTVIVGGFISIIVGFIAFKRTEKGQYFLDSFVLRVPLVGEVVKSALVLRFLKAFDILVNNKVPILEALKVLEDSTFNLAFKEIVTEMRKDVSKGLPIAGALLDNKHIVPPLVAYSISMGEKSGALGDTISRVSGFIDKDLVFAMKKLSSRLDPVLTLGIGIMVLFIALAIYLPIFDMMTQAG